MRKIFKFSLLLLIVFIFGNFVLPNITFADTLGPNDPTIATNDTGVGTIEWIDSINTTSLDNSYTTAILPGQTVSNYLKATNYGFNIPSNAIISGIQIDISKKASFDERIKDKEIKIIKNGTISGDNKANTNKWWQKTESIATYGNSNDLWGETWTVADVNSSNFGLVISAENTNTALVNRTASINNIKISVTYGIPETPTDTTPPIITLTGDNTINLNVGDTYTESGATATDNIDVSVTVTSSGSVDTTTAGTYTIHYNATDTAGNKATEVTRIVYVTTSNGNSGNGGGNGGKTHLDIKTDIDVPASCNVTDTDGIVHEYPKGDSYWAICATETAIKNGSISNVKFSNQYPSLGLFVTSVNDVTADPSNQYWAIYQNGNFANLGIASLPITTGDTIMFQLHDFSDNSLGDQVALNVHSLINSVPTVTNGASGGSGIVLPTFDIQKALAYLKSTQDADGSFGGSSLYTDWVGISFGAMSVTDSSKDKLLAYFNSHNTLSSLLTDNERHAMSLLALGQNPYSFNGVNYIKSITDSFNGTQFGDPAIINDDIFALIPLKNSGYTASDDMIIKDIAFLISKQKSDGSWENSVDVTSASIQALKPFDSIVGVTDSISKATLYLINQQKSDGSWNSIYSTSWAIQAMSALSASWTKDSHTPNDYFNTQQATDGAVLPSSETLQNRVWATSYVIPAILNKPWNTIMQNVSKPASQNILLASTSETTTPDITKKTQTSEIKKSTKAISQSPEENTDTPEINSNALTATAVNTENTTTSNNTTPFMMGFLSGAVVLYLFYFLRKFLVK